ncbi:MAG: hypothetical protein J5833_09100 [Victivallales bacterium]|nr:hypothetical protein [Victivallales bacterium]
MIFKTPFHICNGRLLDCDYNDFPIHPCRFHLTDDRVAAEAFLEEASRDGCNLVHVEFTESLLTMPNGALKEGPALDLLDDFMEECLQRGLYLVFTPITERIRIPDGRSEHAIREDEPIFAERFFDALFRHANHSGGKRFCEYENIAGIEFILALETFTAKRLSAYIHHLGCFVQHFFYDQILELCFLDRGPVPEELKETIAGFTQIQYADWFPDPERIRIPARLDGIPPAAFKVFVKSSNSSSYLPCPAAAAASKFLVHAEPRANGGAEGFVTLESDESMDFQVDFPCEARQARFRPSLRESVPVEACGKSVRFTLPHSRYGVLEVNYGERDLPHFTVYVMLDAVIPAPTEALWLDAGRHEHIDYTSTKTIAFSSGVHYLPDDRLRPCSGHDIYLAPGAVLKCGLTCEKGENIRIYGSGIFDGTLVRRMPGENWKGRADDAFIHFFEGRNIVWDGPMVFNSPFWNVVPEGTRDMTIRHHKAITWAVNSDGIQPRSCVNLLVEDSFFKCSDDSIAIKTRRASGMHSHHIIIRNIVTWNDAGSSLEIGHTSQADLLEDVVFENIEIVRSQSGVCHIYLIDHSEVRGILYNGIYVEGNIFGTPEVSFTISQNFYSTDDTRARIRHVCIKDIHVEDCFHGAALRGFDADHRIEDVSIDGIYVHKGNFVERFTGDIPYHALEFADAIKLT